jgi:hypothetical protein
MVLGKVAAVVLVDLGAFAVGKVVVAVVAPLEAVFRSHFSARFLASG